MSENATSKILIYLNHYSFSQKSKIGLLCFNQFYLNLGNEEFQAWAQSLAKKTKTKIQVEGVSPSKEGKTKSGEQRSASSKERDASPPDVQTRVLGSGVTIKPTFKKTGKKKTNWRSWVVFKSALCI